LPPTSPRQSKNFSSHSRVNFLFPPSFLSRKRREKKTNEEEEKNEEIDLLFHPWSAKEELTHQSRTEVARKARNEKNKKNF
jgi:hypothetical protein